MTNDQIRIAVAEAMGWTRVRFVEESEHGPRCCLGIPPADQEDRSPGVPDYPTDLDACASFEQSLDEIEAVEYVKHIDDMACLNAFTAITATPIMRCIAFLRVKGLWKEGET